MEKIAVGTNHNSSMTFKERQNQLKEQDSQKERERKELRKSPYKEFLQVNKKAYKAEDWLMGKSPIAYRIFRFLVNNMDSYNAVICSQTILQEKFDIGRTTVYKAIKLLKEKNYVDVYKSGTTNVYAINKNLVWNSWGSNYKYAKFGANIILSESEQEKSVQAKIKAIKHKEVTVKG